MMEWIRCSDRLPEAQPDCIYSADVLISDGTNISIGYFQPEYITETNTEWDHSTDECWHEEGNILFCDYSGHPQITHWKDLPKPPKD